MLMRIFNKIPKIKISFYTTKIGYPDKTPPKKNTGRMYRLRITIKKNKTSYWSRDYVCEMNVTFFGRYELIKFFVV